MYCGSCGKNNDDNNLFCEYCGTPLIIFKIKKDNGNDEKMLAQAIELKLQKKYEESINILSKLMNDGYKKAFYQMGTIYEFGLGVEQNISYAVELYKAAAEVGDLYSQKRLALLYSTNNSSLFDVDVAINYLKKAADQGDIYSQYKLGVLYLHNSKLSEKYYSLGFEYLKKAADNNYLPAKKEIIRHYNVSYWITRQLIEKYKKDILNEKNEILFNKYYYRTKDILKNMRIDEIPDLDEIFEGRIKDAYEMVDLFRMLEDYEEAIKMCEYAANKGSRNALLTLINMGAESSEYFIWVIMQ